MLELRAKGQKIFDDPLMGLSNQKDLTSEDVMTERHSKGCIQFFRDTTKNIKHIRTHNINTNDRVSA